MGAELIFINLNVKNMQIKPICKAFVVVLSVSKAGQGFASDFECGPGVFTVLSNLYIAQSRLQRLIIKMI